MGKRNPQRARINTAKIALKEGLKKRGLFRGLRWRTWIIFTFSRGNGQVHSLDGQRFMRDVHTIGPDLDHRIMPDQEELPFPGW
jgi:hypothetical protein